MCHPVAEQNALALDLVLKTLVSFLCRFRARRTQHNLRATQASAVSCRAPRPLAGAKTRDDGSLRQSDGTYVAGRSQQVSCYRILCFEF